MPIIDLQRRIVESGRIRIGQQVEASSGGRRPAKLDTFRLTSADKLRIEQAAKAYGGEVAEWAAPSGQQWEVVTKATSLDVIVPPSELSFSQAYELWSAGGCQRRCDGVTEQISDGACLCDPADRKCEIHTRLSVMLKDLPGLGVWRIDTQGYYAAVELGGAVQIIGAVAGRGLLPGRLRLDQRTVKRPGANGRAQTYRFAVPVLDFDVVAGALLDGSLPMLQLGQTPAAPYVTPVPQLEAGQGATITEQSQAPQPRPRRRNSAPPIPTSGRSRASTDAPPVEDTPPVATEQPEPTLPPSGQADDLGFTQAGEEAVAVATPAAAAASPTQDCDHPADVRVTTRAGVVCSACGERLADEPVATDQAGGQAAAADPDVDEQPARQPKSEGDEGYWRDRVHAAAAEKGVDHDGIHLIAGALKLVAPQDLAAWSTKALSDDEWRGLDTLFRRLPAQLDVDATTLWMWPIAEKAGLASWDAIDPLVTAAYGKSPDDVGVAEWIAFGLRLHAGEYAAQPAKE